MKDNKKINYFSVVKLWKFSAKLVIITNRFKIESLCVKLLGSMFFNTYNSKFCEEGIILCYFEVKNSETQEFTGNEV